MWSITSLYRPRIGNKWSRDVENAFKAGVEFALIDMLGKEEFENNKEVWFGDENDTLTEPSQTYDIDDVF